MCRLVAYLGTPILLDEVLVKPTNSLVLQSLQARESKYVPTNGDGFGIGWYSPQINSTPAIFRSIFPAWNDANLLNITAHIKSSCFFGHVRAASVGGINSYNCHPFTYQSWMLMHNGEVGDFQRIHRYLRQLLDDDLYQLIKGQTDSEHIFALFLQVARGKDLNQLDEVANILIEVYATIDQLIKIYGSGMSSTYNLCLTDGRRIIATRYCTDRHRQPESMHYYRYVAHDKSERFDGMSKHPRTPDFVLISSEILTDWRTHWADVPINHILMVDEDLNIYFRAVT